jgi:hypothetical protein
MAFGKAGGARYNDWFFAKGVAVSFDTGSADAVSSQSRPRWPA